MFTNDPFEEIPYSDGGHPTCKNDLIEDMVLSYPPELLLLKLSINGPFYMARVEKGAALFAFTPEEARRLAHRLLSLTDAMGADLIEGSATHE